MSRAVFWSCVTACVTLAAGPASAALRNGGFEDDPVGGLLALPVTDTVKRQEGDKVTTVPREGLWLAQTPQMFRYAILRRVLQLVPEVTDEASAMESVGLSPKLVEGDVRNSKVTRPADVELVEKFLV